MKMQDEVNARVAAIEEARRVAPDADFSGLSPDEIRAAAVADVYGPEAIDGRPPDYVAGMLDALLTAPQGHVERARMRRSPPH